MKNTEVIHMAIEPLNSMSAVQVQTTTKFKPVDNSGRTSNTDVTVSSNAGAVLSDATPIVTGTGTDNQGQNQDGQGNMPPSNETVKRKINNLNKTMENTEAVFGIHEGTNRVTIKIVDRQTKEVIKEFPPEKTLDMIEKVWEIAGIMVDEKR